MRIMGICEKCRRTRTVTVRGIRPGGVQIGICADCEDLERRRQVPAPRRRAPQPPVDVAVGDRVELVRMDNDPDPVEPGTTGTVDWVGDSVYGSRQIGVRWDTGRRLMLLDGEDEYRVVARPDRAGS